MQRVRSLYVIPLFAVLLSCATLSQASLKLGIGISNISDLGPENSGAVVYVRGEVVTQVPLLEQRVYQLQDATGRIWVLTRQTAPQPGDKVLIKGQVLYQSIPLAGKEFGGVYVEEQEQLERTP